MSDSRSERSALITYGSETGNAQDVAEELTQIAERLHFLTRVCTLDEVEPVSLCISFPFCVRKILKTHPCSAFSYWHVSLQLTLSNYSVIVVAISTTGQGDLPLNARRLWKGLLRKKLQADYLVGVRFVIFGLGDSSYPKYTFSLLDSISRFLTSKFSHWP